MRDSEDVDPGPVSPLDVVEDAQVATELPHDAALLHGLPHRRLLRTLVQLDFAAGDDPTLGVAGRRHQQDLEIRSNLFIRHRNMRPE